MLLELNSRESNGISVSLLWANDTGETFVEIESETDWSRFAVSPENASDAFIHPYYYETISPECQRLLKELDVPVEA